MSRLANDNFDLLALAKRYGPARPLTKREAWYIDSALKAYETAKGPSRDIIGHWLIREAKRLRGWKSAYSFFHRTSAQGTYTIASYHHRAQLCWSWALHMSIGKRCIGRWFYRYSGQTGFTIPGLISLQFHRQPYDGMVSGDVLSMFRMLCDLEQIQREAA